MQHRRYLLSDDDTSILLSFFDDYEDALKIRKEKNELSPPTDTYLINKMWSVASCVSAVSTNAVSSLFHHDAEKVQQTKAAASKDYKTNVSSDQQKNSLEAFTNRITEFSQLAASWQKQKKVHGYSKLAQATAAAASFMRVQVQSLLKEANEVTGLVKKEDCKDIETFRQAQEKFIQSEQAKEFEQKILPPLKRAHQKHIDAEVDRLNLECLSQRKVQGEKLRQEKKEANNIEYQVSTLKIAIEKEYDKKITDMKLQAEAKLKTDIADVHKKENEQIKPIITHRVALYQFKTDYDKKYEPLKQDWKLHEATLMELLCSDPPKPVESHIANKLQNVLISLMQLGDYSAVIRASELQAAYKVQIFPSEYPMTQGPIPDWLKLSWYKDFHNEYRKDKDFDLRKVRCPSDASPVLASVRREHN